MVEVLRLLFGFGLATVVIFVVLWIIATIFGSGGGTGGEYNPGPPKPPHLGGWRPQPGM